MLKNQLKVIVTQYLRTDNTPSDPEVIKLGRSQDPVLGAKQFLMYVNNLHNIRQGSLISFVDNKINEAKYGNLGKLRELFFDLDYFILSSKTGQ